MSPTLGERLASEDVAERRAACAAAPDDPSAALWLETLAERLADPDEDVVRAAAAALAKLGGREAGAAALLRRALGGRVRAGRVHAALALTRLEPPAPALLPALVEALEAPDNDVRWRAARALVDLGRLHGEVLPVLIGLARVGESQAVRRMAVLCLPQLAPDRSEVAEALLDVSRDRDESLRRAALAAMGGLMAPPDAVAVRLLEVMQADGDACAGAAAMALAGLAQHAGWSARVAGAFEALEHRSERPEVRAAVARARDRLARSVPENRP